MASSSPEEIIDQAGAAYREAAVAQWDKDGRKDVGTCGSYMLVVDGRSRVGRELLRRDPRARVCGSGVSVRIPLPEEIRTQHIDVYQAAGEAAKRVFQNHGVRIVRAYAWID